MPVPIPPSQRQTQVTLDRLLPRIEARFANEKQSQPEHWETWLHRLHTHFPRLFRLYYSLYADRYDFYFHLEDLLGCLARSWLERPAQIKALDVEREQNPGWFQSHQMMGAVCYVDLFAGDLQSVHARIPYFKELGLTYLHLMPLFKSPEGENDGGYAVSSYREVDPRLGSMQELAALAGELRREGISLVVDFVFNHTSDEHVWARRAQAGDLEFQDYYRIFPDRTLPDQYEAHLREIFPDEHPGAFTYRPDMDQWVWTTFHSYQWDLNYANPVVFNRMAEEMLFLANQGVEILRLDAVAFIWKEMGTGCENLPPAHWLIQAYNAVARIAAPALIFKSEAIVHPDDVAKYIHPEECQISYNPLLMALLWESLATRKINLLGLSMRERFQIHPQTAWVNYVRSHDDIGWTFSDEDASRLGMNAYFHRRFLNSFYTGRFPGSFARGLPFQENPITGDVRISGTCASLAGLEKALREEGQPEVDLSIRRVLLIYGIALFAGGIPLLYLGDETGTLNDYSFRGDPAKAGDSRWVHRPRTDWEKAERRHDGSTLEGRVFQGLKGLIELRKCHPVFAGHDLEMIDTGNEHVLGFVRAQGAQRVLVLGNFSEQEQTLPDNLLRLYGLSYHFKNLLTGERLPLQNLKLAPLDLILLET